MAAARGHPGPAGARRGLAGFAAQGLNPVAPATPVRQDAGMLVDLWPPYALTVTTPRLQLRLPREDEIVALAELAARGVHRPGERPFMTSWTEGSPDERAR